MDAEPRKHGHLWLGERAALQGRESACHSSPCHSLSANKEQVQPKLWAYMAGIAENHGMHAVKVGGIEDHVHLLINLGVELGIIKAVQLIKANSSRWMNEHPGPRFEWQEGYFACSVSRSQVPRVTEYIANQKKHHRNTDSETEFRLLLKKHGFEWHP